MGKTLPDHDRITETELAEYWGIKRQTLQKWRSLGFGPAYIKLGAKVTYPRDQIIAFERNHLYAGSGYKIDAGGSNE